MRFTGSLDRRQLLLGTAGAAATMVSGLPFARAQQIGSTQEIGNSSDDRDPSSGETGGDSAAVRYGSPQTQHWRIGLMLETPVHCSNVLATYAVPMEWPEQKVEVVDRVISPLVRAWEARELPGGAKQVVLQMPRVPAGSSVEMTFTFRIERSRILGPESTEQLTIPQRPDRELRMFLGNSPYIDTSNGRIRAASRDLEAKEAENDWQRVEHIYDFVRDQVEYVEGELKNASQALRDGRGDCEEMTSLFVALCRNQRIPARMVWIPDHCYPEFYLEDANGNGHWYPCQAAGTRQFGRMDEYRPVLQKGDRFKVPEKRTPVRYVSEFFRCDKKGRSDPDPDFIREQIEL